MNTKLIEEKYLKKINQFIKHNKSYYLESNSRISDSDFDILKKACISFFCIVHINISCYIKKTWSKNKFILVGSSP